MTSAISRNFSCARIVQAVLCVLYVPLASTAAPKARLNVHLVGQEHIRCQLSNPVASTALLARTVSLVIQIAPCVRKDSFNPAQHSLLV